MTTEPATVPDFWRGGAMYAVSVYLDDEPQPNGMGMPELRVGAVDLSDLRRILKTIAERYCPRHRVRVAVWNPIRQEWLHPGEYPMPADWDGLVELKMQILAGSYHL